MPRAPKVPLGTCRNCGERVFWKPTALTEEQKIENDACEPDKWGRRYPKHVVQDVRWTHKEAPGENNYKCALKEGQDQWSRTFAQPKEWCVTKLGGEYNYGETCNKKVVPDSEEHLMCGIHWARERKNIADREAREQEAEIQRWAREERNKKEAILKAAFDARLDLIRKHGIPSVKARYSYNYGADGWVEVNIKELLVALGEEEEDIEGTDQQTG